MEKPKGPSLLEFFKPENSERAAYALMGLGDLLRGGKAHNAMNMTSMMNQRLRREQEKKEAEARAAAEAKATRDMMTQYFGSMGGGPTINQNPVAVTEDQKIAQDTMSALGFGMADVVDKGLDRRGVPEHVRQAFLWNMSDESALNPNAQEVNPLMPGSRGGFGLNQWTGDRRVALERRAAAAGAHPGDVTQQLDHMVGELNTNESAAGRKLAQTETPQQAAAVLVNDFYRPNPYSAAARTAKYTRMSPERAAEVMASPHVPAAIKQEVMKSFQPQQPAQPQWEIKKLGDGYTYYVDKKGLFPAQRVDPSIQIPQDDSRTAAEKRIERLVETGVPREVAIGITDGSIEVRTDPVTGEMVALNVAKMFTGENPVAWSSAGPESGVGPVEAQGMGEFNLGDVEAAIDAPPPAATPDASDAFGVEGALKGWANTVMDTMGWGSLYPDVQALQADFSMYRETVLNDLASAYNRQPPSWLLKEIRGLTPAPGTPFMGPEAAKEKLKTIARRFDEEIAIATAAVSRRMKPKDRNAQRAKIDALEAAKRRTLNRLDMFGSQGGAVNTTPGGTTWRIVE